MPTYNSPGVYIVEKDFSEYPPSINSSIAGVVGFASRGEPNKAKLITSAAQLVQEFGRPDRVLGGQGVLGALELLTKTNSLYYVRAMNASGVDASAACGYGICPAIAVDGDQAATISNNYVDFLFKVANDVSSSVTPANNRSGAWYKLPVNKWTESIPAAGTRQAGGRAISKAMAGRQLEGFPFTFVSSTSGNGPIGWFVGTYAGSGASIECFAKSGTTSGSRDAICPVLSPVSAITGEVSGNTDETKRYHSHAMAYGGSVSGGAAGGTFFTQSLWAGKGYNYSSITTQNTTNYYGVQIKTKLKPGPQTLFQVFNDGGFEESFPMEFVDNEFAPERQIQAGTVDVKSQFVKAAFYNGAATAGQAGPVPFKTYAESWTLPASWDLNWTLTEGQVVTQSWTSEPDDRQKKGDVGGVVRFVKFIEGVSSLAGGTNGDLSDNNGSFNDTIRGNFIGNVAEKTGLYALDDESLNISMACVPGITDQTIQNNLVTIAENSQNFVALLSPPKGLGSAQAAVNWSNGMGTGRSVALNSSYAAVYWPWVKIFDTFSAADQWVDPTVFAAGAICDNDRIANPWSAPAGLVRGRLTRPFDTEVPLNQGDRDIMYAAGQCVNPIVKFAGDGIVIWGQKTTQRTPTALDRVNIRRLMITLRKALLAATRPLVFEPNDPITWTRVVNVTQPLLNNIRNGRGITQFRVVCDATTNTPLRVDRGELWCKILIKPTKTAEVFVVELNLTNQSTDFGTA